MATNVGSLDRLLRIAAGAILLLLGAFGPLGWWGLIGLAPIATGLLRWCPAYTLIGVNTCGTASRT
ncbi:MAG: DUF2892 domain-containing protein [Acetobacteraceae bacterium]|nr:DUF2892 domain-containing protein [Acetobacteraceae bacterium]MDW8399405.1 DUF2892 domain-containing protein [Acetobacteraceae bacterium]